MTVGVMGLVLGDIGVEQRGARAADAVWRLLDGEVDAAEIAAALSTTAVGIGKDEVVALNFDVEIVFDGESDRVLGGEIEFAVANERLQASAGAWERAAGQWAGGKDRGGRRGSGGYRDRLGRRRRGTTGGVPVAEVGTGAT